MGTYLSNHNIACELIQRQAEQIVALEKVARELTAERDAALRECERLNSIMPCGHRTRFESIIEGGHLPVCQMCRASNLEAELSRLKAPVSDEEWDTYWSPESHGNSRKWADNLIANRAKLEEKP